MRAPLVVVGLCAAASLARADGGTAAIVAPRPLIEVRVEGHSKTTPKTVAYLAHVRVGDPVSAAHIADLQIALMSSELFKTATVRLDEVPGGYRLVATLDDKQSWIAAPTIYVLPSSYAFGVGYAENNLLGEDQKLLLYGQYGNFSKFIFGTYLDPRVDGTPLMVRYDLYFLRHVEDEYSNATPTSKDVARESSEDFLDVAALVGWTFQWWLTADLRLRSAHVHFFDSHTGDTAQSPLPNPEKDGWDTTAMFHVTLDHRFHRFGLTRGAYAQLVGEASIPGVDDYHYQDALLRAYYSWELFGQHELELRTNAQIGRHLPFHEELSLGGVSDLRGYALDQFRGDLRTTFRAEYSVPIARWHSYAFRAIGFWDTGYIAFHFEDPTGGRVYLPSQRDGTDYWRNDVGGGLRLYINSVVLPLLGLDVGYGIEGHSPELYFEVGLTDF